MAEPEFEAKPLHSSQYGETRAVTSKTWLLLLLSRLKQHNFPIFLKLQPRLTFEFSSFSSPYIILFIIILFICYFYLCSIYYSRYLFIPPPLSPIISVVLFLPAVWAPHGQGRYLSLYPTSCHMVEFQSMCAVVPAGMSAWVQNPFLPWSPLCPDTPHMVLSM